MRSYYLRIADISPWRYRELKAYCRQYPEWKYQANKLLGVLSKEISDMPKGNGVSSPTEKTVEKRETYLQKITVIEDCAKKADSFMFLGIIENVCYGVSFERLQNKVYTARRNSFFKARRMFFIELDKIL